MNILYIAVEAVVGFTIDSMALLADAGHNTSDVLSLLLAWGAAYLSQTKPTKRQTYGLRRTSILAALINSILLLVAIGAIAWEAIQRFSQPKPVPGSTLMWVAGIGVVVNALTALLFMRGREHDVNIQSAFLHMAADAGVSAGVILAGLGIRLTGAFWIDPAVSLVVATVIAISTWGLLKASIALALDAVPGNIDPQAVEKYLSGLPGIQAVHDLHIWGMSTTQSALTVHLIKPDGRLDDSLLERTCRELHDRYGIEHATIQLEKGECYPCQQGDARNV